MLISTVHVWPVARSWVNYWFPFSVPKQVWSSSRNTPEPHTTAKHLHKRDYRLPAKSHSVAKPIKIDSPTQDSPLEKIVEPPRITTPCPRSFTPTSQPKVPNKKELLVKVAEISTKTGYQGKPTNLGKETFVVMKKALEGTQRSAHIRNGVRENTKKVWKYVTNLSSRGRASVTPTGKEKLLLSVLSIPKLSYCTITWTGIFWVFILLLPKWCRSS